MITSNAVTSFKTLVYYYSASPISTTFALTSNTIVCKRQLLADQTT